MLTRAEIDVNSKDQRGNSALAYCSTMPDDKNSFKVAVSLIEAGANARELLARDFPLNCLLHVACRSGNATEALKLIEQGADYRVTNLEGETPKKIAETTMSEQDVAKVTATIRKVISGKVVAMPIERVASATATSVVPTNSTSLEK